VLTRDERRALIFLAVVTAAGAVIRATRGAAAGSVAAAVAPDLPGEDLVAQAALSRQAEAAQRPLAPGERVDVDRASEAELERLPRVGKRLAQRIEADRRINGPFGSLAGLGRVPGVSSGLLRALTPCVTFGGVPPLAAEFSPASPGPPQAAAAAASRAGVACAAQVAVNRATREELLCLPGIGTALAAGIVAERDAHGPFRDIADLARVPGIGPTRIEHLKGHVTIP
jgi:competence ComEA-like helix-hairpin-helix protein